MCHSVCLLHILYSGHHVCAIWCAFLIYFVFCITNYDLWYLLSHICASLPIPVRIWHLIYHTCCSLILFFRQKCRVCHPIENIRVDLKVCYLVCILHIHHVWFRHKSEFAAPSADPWLYGVPFGVPFSYSTYFSSQWMLYINFMLGLLGLPIPLRIWHLINECIVCHSVCHFHILHNDHPIGCSLL